MDTDRPSNVVQHSLDDDKPTQVLLQPSVKQFYEHATQYAIPNHHIHQNQHHHNQMYQPQHNHHPTIDDHCDNTSQSHFVPLPHVHLDLDTLSTSSFKALPSNHTKSISHLSQNHYLYPTHNPARTKPSPNGKTARNSLAQQSCAPNGKELKFNPFADENDRHANHFQLSKTCADYGNQTKFSSAPSNGRSVESSPFSRAFGFNRTNLMWTTANPNGGLKVEAQPSGGTTLAPHLHTSPNVSRFQIRTSAAANRSPNSADASRLQAFRPLLPVVDMTGSRSASGKGGSPYRSAANRAIEQMQFKCFDLSDEAGWLNFE